MMYLNLTDQYSGFKPLRASPKRLAPKRQHLAVASLINSGLLMPGSGLFECAYDIFGLACFLRRILSAFAPFANSLFVRTVSCSFHADWKVMVFSVSRVTSRLVHEHSRQLFCRNLSFTKISLPLSRGNAQRSSSFIYLSESESTIYIVSLALRIQYLAFDPCANSKGERPSFRFLFLKTFSTGRTICSFFR